MTRLSKAVERLQTQTDLLKGMLDESGITAADILENMTPAERKAVEVLGGESMVYGIVNGTLDKYGRSKQSEQLHEPSSSSEAGER